MESKQVPLTPVEQPYPTQQPTTDQLYPAQQPEGQPYSPPQQPAGQPLSLQQPAGQPYSPPQQPAGQPYSPPQQPAGQPLSLQQPAGQPYSPPQQPAGQPYSPPQQPAGQPLSLQQPADQPYSPQQQANQPYPPPGYQPGYQYPGVAPVITQQPAFQQTTNTTVVVNQQAVETKRAMRNWSSGLCGCFEDCGSLCSGIFCPGTLLLDVSSRMGEGCFFPCCCPGALLGLRIKLRVQENIEGSLLNDYLAVQCCPQCVLCQLARELNHIERQ